VKLVFKLLSAGLVTAVLSAVMLARNISDGLGSMSVENGDWATNVSTGSKDAGVMLKATVAMGGLLASTRQNSMYYRLASIDGDPLNLGCRYRIEGNDYDADWWSITVYGWDNYLIPNVQKRYSFNNENLQRNDDGSWVIFVDMKQHDGNWLPIGPSGAPDWRKIGEHDFDLLLRLYTPGPAYIDSPQTAALPKVTREACE